MQKYKNKEKISTEEYTTLLTNLLLSKNEVWSFQNEYRVLTDKERIPCKIKRIYFGKNIPKADKDKIYDRFKEKYDFFDMIFNHYQQALQFKPVDIRLYLKRHSKQI